jgi:hypothetical protein
LVLRHLLIISWVNKQKVETFLNIKKKIFNLFFQLSLHSLNLREFKIDQMKGFTPTLFHIRIFSIKSDTDSVVGFFLIITFSFILNEYNSMTLYPQNKAILALSDGTVVHGHAIGIKGTTGGELCFNTSMTGYQEIFTDPSYYGQLMMMTYPHIGNYGTMATRR